MQPKVWIPVFLQLLCLENFADLGVRNGVSLFQRACNYSSLAFAVYQYRWSPRLWLKYNGFFAPFCVTFSWSKIANAHIPSNIPACDLPTHLDRGCTCIFYWSKSMPKCALGVEDCSHQESGLRNFLANVRWWILWKLYKGSISSSAWAPLSRCTQVLGQEVLLFCALHLLS